MGRRRRQAPASAQIRLLQLTLRLRGGAQLGKAVKGRSKEGKGKKDGHEATEEEKRLQDSIRRMEMSDYLKKLTLSKKLLLKEFLDKEEKNSRMNKLKIQNHWRKIMRLVKVESLRKEVDIRSQNHERDVDRKDAIIQMLDRDLEEAEEQFQMALRAHLLNVDQLIDLQDERLLALEKEFELDLRELEQEFSVEKEKIIAQHALEKTELQNIMNAVEQQEKDREAEARQEHEQLREEIRNKNLEDINVLRITLDSNIEELEQHFETAHLNYLQNTDQRTQDFKYLTAKDQDLSRDIELKIRKIERLQSSLSHWRTKINQNVKESTERNRALEEEKNAISSHFQKLKSKMNNMRDDQKKKLTELSQLARTTKKTLDDHLEMAERILKLGELVRKLETEREKILPFYHSSISDEKEATKLTENVRLSVGASEPTAGSGGKPSTLAGAVVTADGIEEDLDDAEMKEFQSRGIHIGNGNVVAEWEYLDMFWKRYNKALLDEMAIKREKEKYESENKELQDILKQYLDGISINDDVMRSNNPLLVVNGRLRLHPGTTPRDDKDKTRPIIEANHMVQTNRVSK